VPCPDDNLFGRLLEGRLTEAQRAPLERHVDECAACTELLAELGKVYAQKAGGTRRPSLAPRVASAPRGRNLWSVELVLGLVQLALAGRLGATWLAARETGDTIALPLGTLPGWILAYGIVWGAVGGVLALSATWGLRRGRGWALRVARLHAWITLPSVILTPLAGYVLAESGSGRAPGQSSGSGGHSRRSLFRSG
jgi:hypothetical protein